jgi:glutamate-1-semialdehyde 2,1-aminomutase
MMHIKTFLLQELHKAGFLCLGTHNLSAAHTDAQVDALLDAYADILPRAGAAARAGDVETMLVTAPLVPLFKVR